MNAAAATTAARLSPMSARRARARASAAAQPVSSSLSGSIRMCAASNRSGVRKRSRWASYRRRHSASPGSAGFRACSSSRRTSASSSLSRTPPSSSGSGVIARRRASCSRSSRTTSARAAPVHASAGSAAGWCWSSRAMASAAISTSLTRTSGNVGGLGLGVAAWPQPESVAAAGAGLGRGAGGGPGSGADRPDDRVRTNRVAVIARSPPRRGPPRSRHRWAPIPALPEWAWSSAAAPGRANAPVGSRDGSGRRAGCSRRAPGG